MMPEIAPTTTVQFDDEMMDTQLRGGGRAGGGSRTCGTKKHGDGDGDGDGFRGRGTTAQQGLPHVHPTAVHDDDSPRWTQEVDKGVLTALDPSIGQQTAGNRRHRRLEHRGIVDVADDDGTARHRHAKHTHQHVTRGTLTPARSWQSPSPDNRLQRRRG